MKITLMEITFEELEIILRENMAEPSSPPNSNDFSEYDSEEELPLNKNITPVIDNILILTLFTEKDFNITTKGKSGFISIPRANQNLIFKALNAFSENQKQLTDDLKKIIFQKLLDSIVNTFPRGITRGPLFDSLVFRNIRVSDLELPYFSDTDDDSDFSIDDENWYNGDE